VFRDKSAKVSVSVLMVAVGLTGCSKGLTRSRAADLIKQERSFKGPVEIEIPVGNMFLNPSRPGYPLKMLKQNGILTVSETGQEAPLLTECLTALTPRGRELSVSWAKTAEAMPGAEIATLPRCWTIGGNIMDHEPCHAAKGTVYSVAVAYRQLNEVTAIRTDSAGRTAEVEFMSHLVPTAAGKALSLSVSGTRAGARFEFYGNVGWSVEVLELPMPRW
jgi:hypothetical protein